MAQRLGFTPGRPSRTARTATRADVCRRCEGAIAVGETYWQTTGGAVHPTCLRLGVSPRPAVPRYQHDPHEGHECPGCGFVLAADDAVVHVSAVAWHRDCRVRWSAR